MDYFLVILKMYYSDWFEIQKNRIMQLFTVTEYLLYKSELHAALEQHVCVNSFFKHLSYFNFQNLYDFMYTRGVNLTLGILLCIHQARK